MAGWGSALLGAVGAGLSFLGSKSASDAASKAAKAQNAINQEALKLAREQFEKDMELREQILGRIGGLSDQLQAAFEAMGAFGGGYFDPEMVNQEAAKRLNINRDAVDRAFTNAASTLAADLKRRGMDASTYAIQREGELAAAGADAYQQAYRKSFDDALAYISGMMEETYKGQDQKAKQRDTQLNELKTVYSTPIGLETALLSGGGLTSNLFGTAAQGASAYAQSASNRASGAASAFGSALDNFLKETGPLLSDWFKS